MSHFAEIDENGIVLRVIVAEQDFIDSGKVGDPVRWIQTSYNTYANLHQEGGVPLRKNYAGIGWRYDSILDAFIPPKPSPSALLNEVTGVWRMPKEYPTDGKPYIWDESEQDWSVDKQTETNVENIK